LADLAAANGNIVLESRARSALAWAYLSVDDLDRAARDARLSLTLAQEGGHLEYEAAACNTLGMVSLAQGNPSEASKHLERALALARQLEDVGAESTYLSNAAVARMMLGDFDGAWSNFTKTFELAEAAGDAVGVASAYTNLAWVAAGRAEWETACDMARRALPMKRRQGHREAEAETLLWLGHALTGLGRLDEALQAYRPSLAIREELGQTALALGVRAGMARAELAAGDVPAALTHVERILTHLDSGGSLDGTWEPLRIHLTCVDTLEAAGDERRDRVLERAATILEERASRITDPEDRQMLLESVPWHRRIMELAR
jgi:tetratricopeptide (TPR) repeat protein